jgi:hypothetical protein
MLLDLVLRVFVVLVRDAVAALPANKLEKKRGMFLLCWVVLCLVMLCFVVIFPQRKEFQGEQSRKRKRTEWILPHEESQVLEV